jgi:hypothetical protein
LRNVVAQLASLRANPVIAARDGLCLTGMFFDVGNARVSLLQGTEFRTAGLPIG